MPNVDVDAMWKRAGADTHVTVQCPHAVHTVTTVTSLAAGVRTAADLTNLGLPVRCDSIQQAIKAEFHFFAEQRNITAQVFVEELGYTVARGILRSVFSERNPQLFYEFMQIGPAHSLINSATLSAPFSSAKNGVFAIDMITDNQVRAILKDYRRELKTKMTVGQQYALLHVQQRMHRERAEQKRKAKVNAERAELMRKRRIPQPKPHTAAFRPKPVSAAPLLSNMKVAPLVTLGGANSVVVPLGLPETTLQNTFTNTTTMSTNVSTHVSAAAIEPSSVVPTGAVISKGGGKKSTKQALQKKTTRRPRARKKTAESKTGSKARSKTKSNAKQAVAGRASTPPRPGLMMLDDDDVAESAAALAAGKTPTSRNVEIPQSVRGAPKLVRQTNGARSMDDDMIDSAAALAVRRNTPISQSAEVPRSLQRAPKLVRQTNGAGKMDDDMVDSAAALAAGKTKPVSRSARGPRSLRRAPKLVREANRANNIDDDAPNSAAALAAGKMTRAPTRRPGLMMLEGDDIPPPPKLVRQTNGAAYDFIDAEAGTEAETRQEEKKAKKRRSRATRKKKNGDKDSVKKRKTSKK